MSLETAHTILSIYGSILLLACVAAFFALVTFYPEILVIAFTGLVVWAAIVILSSCAGDGQLIQDRFDAATQRRCEMRKKAGAPFFQKGETCVTR